MGMSSRQRKVMEIYGEDVYDIFDEIFQEQEYMNQLGIEVNKPSTLIMKEIPSAEAA